VSNKDNPGSGFHALTTKRVSDWSSALLKNVARAPAMQFRDFRLLVTASLFDGMAFIGESVILGWVILEMTDSPFMVGVAMSIRHAPAFFLGLVGGTIADIVDRRKLMRSLNVLSALVALSMAVLLISGEAKLWHLLLLPAIGGTIATISMTTRQSFVYDVLGRQNALRGLALIGLATRTGGMVGALILGGILAKYGPGAGYFVLSGGYLISTLILTLISSRGQAAPTGGLSIPRGLLEFWTELRHNRTVSALVVIIVLVEFFGFTTQTLMPSLARDVLHIGPGGLGVLSAFRSGGGMLAIAAVSTFGEIRHQGLALIAVIQVFGAALVVLGFASNIYVTVIAIVIMSGMMALSDLFSQTLMQRLVPNELRGRAMGAWSMAVGTAPIGSLEIGALASVFGITVAFVFHGSGLIAVSFLTLAAFGRLRRV
jgi:MFS family permease